MLSDDEVIQAVRDGNTRHFEIIVNRYKTPILNFVYRMISDYEEAENLTQDVFLKIFKNLNRYKKENNFQAYIFTIARNMTINTLKKRKRMVAISRLFSGDRDEEFFHHHPDIHSRMEKKDREQQLTKAINGLKENQKIALVLKVYLEFSYKKIAEVTGWSIPKIETLISRAKSQLKTTLLLQENDSRNVKKVREK